MSYPRELNSGLDRGEAGNNDIHFDILNPRGHHAVAVGVAAHLTVDIKGSGGYYCAGMNDGADIVIHGSAGHGVAEKIIVGTVVVERDGSQYSGAAGHARALPNRLPAPPGCGLPMKGYALRATGKH